MKKIINILEKRIDQHKNSMLVTVVSRSGSAPGREGAVMLVGEDGYITGTIGGGMMEYKCIALAQDDLKVCQGKLRQYRLTKDEAAGLGMVCGGDVDVLFTIVHANDKNRQTVQEVQACLNHYKKGWLIFNLDGSDVSFSEEWTSGIARQMPYTTKDEKGVVSFKNPNNGKSIVVKDCIADAFLQNILLYPESYDVVCAMNLNGDYISDALAAQVGGIGIAPGANIGTGVALFEATHGTAPTLAGLKKANPGSIILSAEMLLRHIGWFEAADLIVSGMENAISKKTVTVDFYSQMENAVLRSTDEFADDIVANM